MRKSSYILYNIALLLTMTAALMTACTSDHAEGSATPTDKESSKGHDIQLVTYANYYMEQNAQRRAAPSGFSPYTPDRQTNMGIYMLLSEATDWNNPQEELFRYISRWTANIEVQTQKEYYVYGYMPKLAGMTSTLTKSKTPPYTATLTITGIKAITSDGLYVITGVKNSDSELREGSFLWRWDDLSTDIFNIHLLMDHLYASMQFRMKIDEEYAKLRTIKLKTMTLSTNKSTIDVTVTLNNTAGTSPIGTITYTMSGNNCESEIFNNGEGEALSTLTALEVNAGLAPEPQILGNLTLVSTYDVYDSKGNLIRQNCSATNTLPDNLQVNRGERMQLNMTVEPTYLYVLSEPDLDNPTIRFN